MQSLALEAGYIPNKKKNVLLKNNFDMYSKTWISQDTYDKALQRASTSMYIQVWIEPKFTAHTGFVWIQIGTSHFVS